MNQMNDALNDDKARKGLVAYVGGIVNQHPGNILAGMGNDALDCMMLLHAQELSDMLKQHPGALPLVDVIRHFEGVKGNASPKMGGEGYTSARAIAEWMEDRVVPEMGEGKSLAVAQQRALGKKAISWMRANMGAAGKLEKVIESQVFGDGSNRFNQELHDARVRLDILEKTRKSIAGSDSVPQPVAAAAKGMKM